VNDGVKWLAVLGSADEYLFNSGTVGEVAFDEGDACGNKIAPAMAQVVEYSWFVTLRSEKTGDSTTYVTGTAGNQNPHKNTVLP
jgi:hypothetical protein